ncbi:glycosyltransferase family 4 protein [Methylomonas sp. UP202]|uniref:glycosyltransferase family 4 protein n=1 Tax=Methylomonas sp. UP202 TaxID=3040943 RepID=UPI001439206C|nr:glycosyltransferase family 4 protein [Methylomonas sp. UP202]NJA04844.1 glycosyltransferase family 4 protein [Methylococcaceae bacterium WWC4]WGS87798.1 glycosyltransferase family 4 protein [Methylomonas sp. UP202]
MKFLLTVHQFYPEYFSGTEVLTYSVARELLARGHEVAVFTGYPARELMTDARRFDKYEINGIQVYRFYHGFVPMGQQQVVSEIEYNNQLAASYFKGLLNELAPDIVHFFHFSRLGAALVDVIRQLDISAYYTPTDFWAVCPTSQLLLADGQTCLGPTSQGGNCIKHVAMITHWRHYSSIVHYLPDGMIDKIAVLAKSGLNINFPFSREIAALSGRKHFNIERLNALQGIVAPTKLMADVLTSNGVKPELITQSAYGINITGFEDFNRSYSVDRSVTIGYIGTLAPHKGCHILIDAFTRLERCGMSLKIYGNPKEFPEYVAGLYSTAKGNDSIEFCGTFPNNQIADVLSGIDILVVPSVWYENTPLVVYSALAAKCPVIASDFPGMSEVVRDGWNGLLFEPSNSIALADCFKRLYQEPTLLISLSDNCQSPKSIATYVDELLDLYEKKQHAPKFPLVGQQELDAYIPANQGGYVVGWASIGANAPKRIGLISNNQEIGKTTQFLPRPDVRDGLRNSGVKIDAINLGFIINLTQTVDGDLTFLQIEAMDGNTYCVPYESLQIGQSVFLESQLWLGLDQEYLIRNIIE